MSDLDLLRQYEPIVRMTQGELFLPRAVDSYVGASSLWELTAEKQPVELAPEGRALQQIKDRGYADKYRAEGQPIHLIGIEFSRERRSLVGFEVESLDCESATPRSRMTASGD